PAPSCTAPPAGAWSRRPGATRCWAIRRWACWCRTARARTGWTRAAGCRSNATVWCTTSRSTATPAAAWCVRRGRRLWRTARVADPASAANAFVYGVAAARDGGLWLVGTGGVLDWLDPHSARLEHRLERVCGDRLPYVAREMVDRSVWIGCHGTVTRWEPGS